MIVDLVSAAQQSDWEAAKNLLYQHWALECPKLYAPNPDQPWEVSQDDSMISKSLFNPLAAVYCADSTLQEPTLTTLNEQAGTTAEIVRAGQICGHVFKSGELTYTCKDCATDPTCVMCHSCFRQSEHTTHKYRMHTSSGAGFCDCGDPDAWRSGYACKDHMKENAESIPFSVPEDIKTRLIQLTTTVLQYTTSLICWLEEESAPSFLKVTSESDKQDVATVAPFVTVLYNDETHTYDSVIRCLTMFIHCTKERAMLIATIVDREGRSAVKVGSKAECERVKTEIQRRTSRDANPRTGKNGPLDVKVMDSSLVCQQAHAIALIQWINNQIEVFPMLSEIVGEVLLSAPSLEEPDEAEADTSTGLGDRKPDSLLVKLMRWDRKMWKSARANTHQMLMKTVLMHMDQKVAFSKKFLEHYEEIYSEFIDDDHDVGVSIVSLTVQFLTVPSIAKRLIAEDDALTTVFNALSKHLEPYIKDNNDPVSRFDFSSRSFPAVVKRAMHMMRDQCYMMNSTPLPSEWTDSLRTNYLSGCKTFIAFLHHMQGMDEVKRMAVEHQVWELEWETAFNIQLRIQEIISLALSWAAADQTVHRQLLEMCLDAMELHPPSLPEDSNGETHTVVNVNGIKTICGAFDVLRGAVSIHQPLWRLTAGLFAVNEEFLVCFKGLNELPPDAEQTNPIAWKVKKMRQNLYEMPLRVLVLCAQASALLWRRNGFSLVNQIHNYYSPLCRTEMFDRDLLMMQVGAATTPSLADFVLHIMCRYRVAMWADDNYDSMRTNTQFGKMEPEETSKIIVLLAEEMLHLLILIIGERFQEGVGKCTVKDRLNREVLHILCCGPQPFSHIQKRISHDPINEKLSLHDAVNAVADFKKPASTTAGNFHLKDSLLPEYNPFFYHFSKSDLSQAEQYQQKTRNKNDRKLMACPPPIPCQFEPFFEPVRHLLKEPVVVRCVATVLDRTARRNRFSSDKLLHRALYLIGMALNEQAQDQIPIKFNYLAVASDFDILKLMEALTGTPEVASHADLLWWTIQRYKEVERRLTLDPSIIENKAMKEEVRVDTGDADKAKRSAKAAQMRNQAMMKMAKMQNSFMKHMTQPAADGAAGEETAMDTAAASPDTTATVTTKPPSVFVRVDEDEDYVKLADNQAFPVCLGPNRNKIESVIGRKLTCILCQEEDVLTPGGKVFVCAAYIQRSHLFTQQGRNMDLGSHHQLTPANLTDGIDASTCSHTMHYECYQNLSDILLSRERQRPRQQMIFHQKMVDVEIGEYVCPLCKRLSNAAMPLLPALQLMAVPGVSSPTVRSEVKEEFDDWISRMKELLDAPPASHANTKKSHSRKRSHSERSLMDIVKQGDELSSMPLDNSLSTSVPGASSIALVGSQTPSRTMSQSMETADSGGDEARRDEMIRELVDYMEQNREPVTESSSVPSSPSTSQEDSKRKKHFDMQSLLLGIMRGLPILIKNSNKIVGPSFEKYGDTIRGFSKALIACDKTEEKGAEQHLKAQLEDNLRSYMSVMSLWKSTAHVVRASAAVLKFENKPLFGAFNTRQRDCLLAMSRLSAAMSHSFQHLPDVTTHMLRVLLDKPPPPPIHCPNSPNEDLGPASPVSSTPTSPPPLGSSHGGESSASSSATNTTTTTHAPKLLFSPFIQLFVSSSSKNKQQNINLLNVDMLTLAIDLMMSIGWSWHDRIQSWKQPKQPREILPDGSVDELYIVRLCLTAHYFQVFASMQDAELTEEVEESPIDARLKLLWTICKPYDPPLRQVRQLQAKLKDATLSLLRPLALFCYAITLVPPPESLKDPSLDEFEPLCRYMGLPTQLIDLLGGHVVERLFDMWSGAIPFFPAQRNNLVSQPIRPNLLVDLPDDYGQVINLTANFKCPSIPLEENSSYVPTMCLVCGRILCSQSYCCQRVVNKENIGACRYHMMNCSGPMGAFLRIRDCSIILMTTRKRGCFKAAPYVDEFGEADQGFRRGNPLHLNKELYHKLRVLWLHQGITEEVVNQYEIDNRNLQYDWAHF